MPIAFQPARRFTCWRQFMLIALLLLLAGCGRIQNERIVGAQAAPVAGVELELHPPVNPMVGVPGEVRIGLAHEGVPLSGAHVAVEGNMTHAGMQPVFVTATEAAPGDYLARLEWTMSGEWFLTARATLPGGEVVERTVYSVQVRLP
jgi:hypothetical protein